MRLPSDRTLKLLAVAAATVAIYVGFMRWYLGRQCTEVAAEAEALALERHRYARVIEEVHRFEAAKVGLAERISLVNHLAGVRPCHPAIFAELVRSARAAGIRLDGADGSTERIVLRGRARSREAIENWVQEAAARGHLPSDRDDNLELTADSDRFEYWLWFDVSACPPREESR